MVSVTEAYLVLLIGSTPFLLAALNKVLNNLHRRGSRPLAALLVGTLVWMLSALAVAVAPSFRVGLIANRFQYFGITAVPAAFLLFALAYVDREDLVNGYSVGLLSLEPLAAIALVWTNRSHDLWTAGGIVRKGATYVADGTQTTCDAVICFGDSGPAFVGHTLYSYGLLLAGAVLVLSRALRSSAVPRGQVASMAVAVFSPLVANALSLFVLPSEFPDLTPIAFGVSGVAIAIGLYRFSLVETDALTGAAAVDARDAGAVLVRDDSVEDVNVDGAKVLGVDADTAVGSPVDDVFEDHDSLRAAHPASPTEATGELLDDPITGESYRVTVEEVSPDGTPKTGWVYEFSKVDRERPAA
ncbi:histidine kinase N-terminal 7TM domain-containing protein [Halorubellus sp. PRR65]|uniref:histidine kinase N-terminal 7TM domain-containing protein n=1 Tax=Halorubellus sp. PRR65 TaxID=3098148 RepID=UPI002B257BC5|nr:histidine kinase N-terminal 7TM domain-containing protein [Halorubellus sp. PRR65]